MNELVVDVMTLHHGIALKCENPDPALDPRFIGKIDSAVFAIMVRQDDVGQGTIFTSPARKAIETGEILLQSRHLKDSKHLQPISSPFLADGAFTDYTGEERELRWVSALHEMARVAISQTAASKRPGLVLVTREPVIRELPPIKSHRPKLKNLGLNNFFLSMES